MRCKQQAPQTLRSAEAGRDLYNALGSGVCRCSELFMAAECARAQQACLRPGALLSGQAGKAGFPRVGISKLLVTGCLVVTGAKQSCQDL